MFEFEEFKKEVIKTYRDRLTRHELDAKLENPTPGNLRNLSLKLFANGLSPEDTIVFQDFFNPINRYDDLETSIRRFELDRLKPLKNFMMAKTSNPDENIVKLLAILTQFAPRPFHKWREMRHLKETDSENNPLHAARKSVEIKMEEKSHTPLTPQKVASADDVSEINNCKIDDPDLENRTVEKKVERPTIPTDDETMALSPYKLNKKENPKLWKRMVMEKPPSKDHLYQGDTLRYTPQFKHLFYLLSFTLCMISLCSILNLLSLKSCACWIEIQYVAANTPHDGQYSKRIASNQNEYLHFKKITQTDTAIDANQISFPQSNHSIILYPSAVWNPHHQQAASTSYVPYIILLYALENPAQDIFQNMKLE